ncbi:class I SAM-dependent methyltransferase [Streptomyces sp. AC495_CC817]|uniref:class I SAM-dependent methyltransferase n=1 Tax=Streptomyces sp. AC495_CC817 TaxID=2823900 RepID=UPI001C2774CC|nr:class I SAM-dependent methyltransferase [Streptomyces sp. AC495_CC817]
MVDETLARSFEEIGEDYERFRPAFPAEAADLMIPQRVETIVDLGAGTGKFTERLLGRADRLIAVEPSAAMLDVLRVKLPGVLALDGTAERIPLPDAAADALTVAQAFHWFDRESACREIARVLRPGGVLGLVWNGPDPSCTWDLACRRIIRPRGDTTPPGRRPAAGRTARLRVRASREDRLARADHPWGLPPQMVYGEHPHRGRRRPSRRAARRDAPGSR